MLFVEYAWGDSSPQLVKFVNISALVDDQPNEK